MPDTDFSLPPGTHTVILGLGDLNGIMRGKRIPASHWETICEGGNALSIALFALDMTCDVWDTPYVSLDNGDPDWHLFPVSKPVTIPWEPGVAMAFARAEGMDHLPVPLDPRLALERQIERAAEMGIDIQVGTELEFYLLDPETGLPKDSGIQVYGMERAAELKPVDPIVTDHLGDVYWAVGRKREAEFQWRRALSFNPEPDEAERIRRKLDVGLDVVLEEEGAPSLAEKAANAPTDL